MKLLKVVYLKSSKYEKANVVLCNVYIPVLPRERFLKEKLANAVSGCAYTDFFNNS